MFCPIGSNGKQIQFACSLAHVPARVRTIAHLCCRLRWVQGAVVSSALVAAAAGSAAGGRLSDVIGRRKSLLAADVLFTAGAVMMGFARNVEMVIAGKLSSGPRCSNEHIAWLLLPEYTRLPRGRCSSQSAVHLEDMELPCHPETCYWFYHLTELHLHRFCSSVLPIVNQRLLITVLLPQGG